MAEIENTNSDTLTRSRSNYLTLLPEAVFITAITAGSYWFAFQYERGFFEAYGLPTILLEIDSHIILKFAGAFLAITTTWFFIVNPFGSWLPRSPDLKRKVVPLIASLLFAIWYAVAFGFKKEDYVVYLIFGGMGLALSAIEFLPKTPQTATALDGIIAKVGKNVARMVISILVLNWLALLTGMAAARNDTDFLVPADNPNSAIIRIYGDKIIAVSFDRKTKMLTGEVLMWKLDKDDVKLILEKNIGPLSPKRTSAPMQPVLQKSPPAK